MKEITVVGHCAYDYIFTVAKHLSEGSSSYIEEWKRCYGGGGANIAVGIAKLGGKSKLYSIAGRDFKRYEKYLERVGVKTLLNRSEKRVARAYIFNVGEEQIIYFYWGASEDMRKMKGIKTKYLHIAPCHPELAVKMVEKGDFIVFEPGQDLKRFDRETLSYIIEHSEIIFCNENEMKQMEKLIDMRGKNVIVTLGKKGSIIRSKKIKIPSLPAKMKDATGAGDAYKAGFWVGLMKGYEMEVCCRIGSVVASFVVEKIGAQHVSSWERMEKRYRKFFGKNL
ncbi:MAG TPA: carbohydrate kinase family protein [Thermoplasmatales archaeon]|nr:carbohydrate kinase family protein [Thermoplasmatales archaeon]